MNKDSGFTLIELLLVLAIIGIISAIAIPAMIGQRDRARDRVCIDNMAANLGDLYGQYNKMHENGSANYVASLNAYLLANHGKDKDPWKTSIPAFQGITSLPTATSQSAFAAAMTVSVLGQVRYYIKIPTDSGVGGYLGGVVKLASNYNNSSTYRRVAGIE